MGEPGSREGILRHRKGIFRVKVGEEARVSQPEFPKWNLDWEGRMVLSNS